MLPFILRGTLERRLTSLLHLSFPLKTGTNIARYAMSKVIIQMTVLARRNATHVERWATSRSFANQRRRRLHRLLRVLILLPKETPIQEMPKVREMKN
jgi:hypothetical protein